MNGGGGGGFVTSAQGTNSYTCKRVVHVLRLTRWPMGLVPVGRLRNVQRARPGKGTRGGGPGGGPRAGGEADSSGGAGGHSRLRTPSAPLGTRAADPLDGHSRGERAKEGLCGASFTSDDAGGGRARARSGAGPWFRPSGASRGCALFPKQELTGYKMCGGKCGPSGVPERVLTGQQVLGGNPLIESLNPHAMQCGTTSQPADITL
jgi:hypothetical protein